MRARRAIACLCLLGVGACGGREDHVNGERPPSSINVTAAIIDGRILVSPRRFGAGPIRLIVTNQTDSARAVRFETDAVGGGRPAITQTTAPIAPSATATLELDVRRGRYAIATADGDVAPAKVTVGAPRPSAQGDLLLP